jgi:hypothetical protein
MKALSRRRPLYRRAAAPSVPAGGGALCTGGLRPYRRAAARGGLRCTGWAALHAPERVSYVPVVVAGLPGFRTAG